MWKFVHNCIAHPLLFFFCDALWAVRLHDFSRQKMPRKYTRLDERQQLDPKSRQSAGSEGAAEGLRIGAKPVKLRPPWTY